MEMYIIKGTYFNSEGRLDLRGRDVHFELLFLHNEVFAHILFQPTRLNLVTVANVVKCCHFL